MCKCVNIQEHAWRCAKRKNRKNMNAQENTMDISVRLGWSRWQALPDTAQMQENILKRHENAELDSLISINFDPKGPRKSYSNIVDRDPSSGATLRQCCSCVVQFVQGHIPEKHQRKH